MSYNFTFEDLEKDPFQKEIIEILEQIHGHPLPDDMKALFVDYAGNAQLRVDQRVSWLKTAVSSTQHIIKGIATPTEYPFFWIRVWSIVREFAPYLQRTRELGSLSKLIKPQLEAMDALMATLSADDLCFIDFMRHNHAHLHVDYVHYHAQTKKNGTLKINPPKDPNVVDLAQKIFSLNNGDQKKIACSYAKKIIEPLKILSSVVTTAAKVK